MRQDVILKTHAKKSLQARKKTSGGSAKSQRRRIFFCRRKIFFPVERSKNPVEVLFVLKSACFQLKTSFFALFSMYCLHPWTVPVHVSISQRSICSVRPVLCPFSVLPHRVLRKTARIWRCRKSMCKQNRHLCCQCVKWRADVPPMPLIPRVRVLRVCRRQSCRRSGGCRA